MKTYIMAAFLAAMACTGPNLARAQSTSTTNGAATATSNVDVFAGNGGAGTDGSNGNGSGSNGGEYRERLNQNVDAVAPTVYGGTNPCGNAVSAGLSFAGVGISGGASSEQESCVKRSWFVLTMTAAAKFNNPAFEQWGVNIACTIPSIASAAPAGMCAPAPGTKVPAQVALVTTMPVVAPARVIAAPAQPPAYCDTWDKGDGPKPAACH